MRAIKVQNRRVRWVWKERVPAGMITVIGGRPGQSKSLLMVRIAADVSKTGTVILSCAEDQLQEMIGPRLTAFKANKQKIILPDDDPILPDDIRLPDDIAALRKCIIRYKVKLAIFDPINVHLGEGVKRHSDSIRRAASPLKKLGQETGCAFILVDHVLKLVSSGSHPLAQIGGSSSGLPAAARMAYIVGRDPEDKDRVILCNVKSNLREDPEPYEFLLDAREVPGIGDMPILLDGGECEFDVMNLLKRPGKGRGRPPSKREAAIEWLVEYLYAAPNHEFAAEDVVEDARQAGITKRTLENAKAEAGIISQKVGKAWVWRLSKDMLEALEE